MKKKLSLLLLIATFMNVFANNEPTHDIIDRDLYIKRHEGSIPAHIEYEEGSLRLTFDDNIGVVVCDVQDCASGDSWGCLFDSRFEGQLYLGKEDGIYTITIETEDGVIFHETCEIIKNRSL